MCLIVYTALDRLSKPVRTSKQQSFIAQTIIQLLHVALNGFNKTQEQAVDSHSKEEKYYLCMIDISLYKLTKVHAVLRSFKIEREPPLNSHSKERLTFHRLKQIT